MRKLTWLLAGLLAACSGDSKERGGDGGAGGAGDDAGIEADAGAPDAGGAEPGARPAARFVLSPAPEDTPLAQIPFPSDLYRAPDGRVTLKGFPRPNLVPLLEQLITEIEAQRDGGFGTTATLYVSFEAPLDLTALPPDGAASITDDSTVSIIDLDPASPEKGRRWPLYWHYDENGSAFLPPHTLAIRLVEGLCLRPKTTYGLVVTTGVATQSEAFAETLGASKPDDDAAGAAWERHAPLRAWVEGALGGDASRVAVASVFTTQDPVGELFAIRRFMQDLPPPPVVSLEDMGEQQNRFRLFHGTYEAPRFQKGEVPYRMPGSGGIELDADEKPVIQGTETLRFSLAVPLGVPPPEGWPVVMYGHGTGGDWESYIGERIGSVLARNGLATISIDQIHHGPRSGGACDNVQDRSQCEALLFFNFLVPQAGRNNVRQSALDFVTLLRLVKSMQVPPYTDGDSTFEVRFDGANVMYMGHSQGGLNGPLFLAIEPDVKGGMLSGAGASFALAVEQKKLPVDINAPVAAVLRLAADDPLDRWHPVLSLLQTFIEAGDGVNYARFWFDEPPAGQAPKSVFMTIGLHDEYTPPVTNFALATAGRVPIIDPVAQPIDGLDLLGIQPTFPPYRGNVADGAASAGLAQYADGDHFVIFDISSATQRYGRFLSSLATETPPNIY